MPPLFIRFNSIHTQVIFIHTHIISCSHRGHPYLLVRQPYSHACYPIYVQATLIPTDVNLIFTAKSPLFRRKSPVSPRFSLLCHSIHTTVTLSTRLVSSRFYFETPLTSLYNKEKGNRKRKKDKCFFFSFQTLSLSSEATPPYNSCEHWRWEDDEGDKGLCGDKWVASSPPGLSSFITENISNL